MYVKAPSAESKQSFSDNKLNRLIIANVTRQETDREFLSVRIFNYLPHKAIEILISHFQQGILLALTSFFS